jgi:hypothetical protein
LLHAKGVKDAILHEFHIPVSHLSPGIPKWSIHGHKISEDVCFERELEIIAIHAVASLYLEVLLQSLVQVMIPANIVTQVEKLWL